LIILANESIYYTDVDVLSDRREVFTLLVIMGLGLVKGSSPDFMIATYSPSTRIE
jgi:hypothetical protein